MTTFSTNTVCDCSTDAGFQNIVNEWYTALVTNLGLTQTGDTGQLAVPFAGTRPAINTIAGYYVFRFNDTLQATAPIFFKMEFGVQAAQNLPRALVTVGTSTNGAGTITGAALAQSIITCSTGAPSTVTNFVSRYCYTTTQGALFCAYKILGNPNNTTSGAYFGFAIWRSIDNTGAPTATSTHFIATSNTTSIANSGGIIQVINNSGPSVVAFPDGVGCQSNYMYAPYKLTSPAAGTVTGGNAMAWPAFQIAPTTTFFGPGITNAFCLVTNNDASIGTTFTTTLVGTSLTYITVGIPWNNSSSVNGNPTYTAGVWNIAFLWQ